MDVLVVDLLVVVVIAAIVWYFFLSRRRDEAHATAGPERQEITVRVKGGYIPEVVRAQPGLPVRIHFRREETSPCSEEVVFPTLGVRRHLPAFETTDVDLPASPTGTYAFSCGMDMMHGWLVLGDLPNDMPRSTAADESWPTDPVCGMKVDPRKAAATLEREGRTYYFCCAGCKERFENGPAKTHENAPLIRLDTRRKP
jgi:Cu+-exporting ATPase